MLCRRLLSLLLGLALCATARGWAVEPESIALFNGKDLSGWTFYLEKPDAKMEDVWSVRDGVLVCKGDPMGYLATKDNYKNFKLIVEWRWAPGKEPGNSGVLLRITGKPMMLPKCVEAQLKSGDAGDIWAFQGFKVQGDAARSREVNHPTLGHLVGVSKKEGNEKPPGEWNKYEIHLQGDKLTLIVNGKPVNEGTGCDLVAGQIALQSEGGEIHFRTVSLVPLED
ncbi:MAG: DUF1080 domain-containing protein [Pirellulaceae bacterium]|jgi:hypothetical protein|nr:DUF1080 domain-containing protein [Pirellulaceae bacterium]